MNQDIERLPQWRPGAFRVQEGKIIDFPMHAHAYYEMTLYQPFAGGLIVNGQEIKADALTAVLVTPNDLHRICVNGDCDARCLKVECSQERIGLQPNLLPQAAIINRNVPEDSFLARLFQEILARSGDEAYVSLLIGALVLNLASHGELAVPAQNMRRYDLVSQALGIIHADFCSDLSLNRVAKALAVTPQYLSRVFSEEMGVSFSAYVSELRMRRAAELMKHSQKSVTEACFACGYGNLSHFIRSFKRRFGVTPWRYGHKEGGD